MDKNSIFKIVTDRIKAIEATEFQFFCDRLLLKLFPAEYTPVRAGGRYGDMKNDGYCFVSRKFFQAHASRGEATSKIENKIKTDLAGCLNKQRDVKEFIYITNDTSVGKVEHFIDDLRGQHPNIRIQTWGPDKIASTMMEFPLEDIEFILDRTLSENPQSSQINYNFVVEKEENDLGIIGEIFDYIFKKIGNDFQSTSSEPDTIGKLRKLRDKIKLNFTDSHQLNVQKTFSNNWQRNLLVEQYVQSQMEVDENKIYALVDLIQTEYSKIIGADNCETPIKDFSTFEIIGKTFLPPVKRWNPEYISNAKSIVLYFFELCAIGKKTGAEATIFSQRNLFEEVN